MRDSVVGTGLWGKWQVNKLVSFGKALTFDNVCRDREV